jgi:3-phosphoglycerate kinase
MEKGKILDIGARAIKEYSEIIKKAKTIVWNGPMGYIEAPKFRRGSEAIAEAIMKSSAKAVIGGGETTSLCCGKNPKKNIFISTGGGAMLEYLAGKKLPGITALLK